jgi:hypothetical protein
MIWQGDFGKGVSTGSGVFSSPGVAPYTLYGPLAATATTVMVNAVPALPFKVGTVVRGDIGTQWVFCRWVPTGTTDLMPGMVFIIDENYTALAVTTALAATNKNASCGVSVVFQPAVVAGTYYLWLCRVGNVAVQAAAASLAGGQAESGATAGQVKFLNTHTATTWSVVNLSAYGASSNITFTGDTVINQPYINNVSSLISVNGVTGGITDLTLGMVVAGTGLTGTTQLIKSIERYQGTWRIGLGSNATGAQNTNVNAASTQTAQTYTVSNMVQGLVYGASVANLIN